MIVKLGETTWVNPSEVRDLRLREENDLWLVTVSLKDGSRFVIGAYNDYNEGKKILDECGELLK